MTATADNTKLADRSHLTALDGLKGLCACIIAFIWHYQNFEPEISPLYSLFKPFYDHGYMCVEVFFMLSGFGMILGYEKRILDGAVTGVDYWFRRVKKLFPIMIFATVIIAVIHIVQAVFFSDVFEAPLNVDAYHFLLNILGLQYGVLGLEFSFNAPIWFVSVLLTDYLLLWLIIYFLKNKREAVPLFYMIMAVAGCILFLADGTGPFFNGQMGRGISSFFVGCVLAKVHQNKDKLNTTLMGYIALGFLILNGILSAKLGYEILGNFTLYAVLGLAPCVLLATLYIGWLNKFLGLLPFAKLGSLSVGIFFLHYPIQLIWSTVALTTDLGIDFSRIRFWGAYVLSVMIVAILYDLFLKKRINGLWNLFVRKDLV